MTETDKKQGKGQPTVLYVDDEGGLLRAYGRVLGAIRVDGDRIKVVTFDNPQDALVWLLDPDNEAAVVLCDMNMPVMDGTQLHTAVQTQLGENTPPWIFFSGNPSQVKLATYAAQHGLKVILKPPNDIDDVKRAIAKHL